MDRRDARQVVLVTGDAPDSSYSTVHLYERDAVTGWRRAFEPWPARNGQRGWTEHHTASDRSTPVGVFDLTDAGGLLPDPGSKLPYDESPVYDEDGVGFLGQSLEGAFDHVVAINYNRQPGTPPRDLVRPLGEEAGGGIFVHMDHGGPTQACVALPRKKMTELLKWLDPKMNPVIAMGDIESVTR
ncbi:L,D-transpeptidase family protein [Streptomyces sp. Je 1-332]|uniref:L,D-transpeptidase family protein n=1 Tax=Streptomyces sp. Je 1-332 TaxID=3231270 RepID=UPI00345A1759